MSAHVKKHEKHKSEQCNKSFKYLDLKKKHILIRHENVKLYCHFFNNDKTCPFYEECIFLHKDATFCKYDGMCERNFCMFKHRKKIEEHDHIEPDEIIDAIENISVSVVDEEDVVRDEINELDNANTTFYNPSQLENKSAKK